MGAAEELRNGLSEIGAVGGAIGQASSVAMAYTRCTVQGKGLTTLQGLESFPHLRALNASSNGLTAEGVGASLGACPSLTELSLAANSLTDPMGLPSLQVLQLLDLSGNQLTSPADLSSLPALTSLDLSNNTVASVAALGSAPCLRRLNLSGNQLSAVTSLAASCPGCTRAVCRYLASGKAEGSGKPGSHDLTRT